MRLSRGTHTKKIAIMTAVMMRARTVSDMGRIPILRGGGSATVLVPLQTVLDSIVIHGREPFLIYGFFDR
jgi:hypothetical protein